MELTDFPEELQLEYLSDLPVHEIIQYCYVNQAASNLCRSESFWRLKEKRIFGTSYYQYVNAKTPTMKYRILEKVLGGSDPLNTAVIEGQALLVRALWDDKSWGKLSHQDLYDALDEGHFDLLEVILDLIPDEEQRTELFTSLYNLAVEDANLEIASYFRPILGLSYTSLLNDFYDLYGDVHWYDDLFKKIIDEGLANGEMDIVQTLARDTIAREYPPMLDLLIRDYPQHLDLVDLFQRTIANLPMAQRLLQYVRITPL